MKLMKKMLLTSEMSISNISEYIFDIKDTFKNFKDLENISYDKLCDIFTDTDTTYANIPNLVNNESIRVYEKGLLEVYIDNDNPPIPLIIALCNACYRIGVILIIKKKDSSEEYSVWGLLS